MVATFMTEPNVRPPFPLADTHHYLDTRPRVEVVVGVREREGRAHVGLGHERRDHFGRGGLAGGGHPNSRSDAGRRQTSLQRLLSWPGPPKLCGLVIARVSTSRGFASWLSQGEMTRSRYDPDPRLHLCHRVGVLNICRSRIA